MKGIFKHSKGQMMVLFAGIIATLLGAIALCTDVAVMYVNSIQVQKAVDTAARFPAQLLHGERDFTVEFHGLQQRGHQALCKRDQQLNVR